MGTSIRYKLEFAPEVVDHLVSIERKHHGLIRKTLDEQLLFSPSEPTRNRKPLDQPAPFGAIWELRLGPRNRFRAFYEVDEIGLVVRVLAIGIKEENRLRFGGKEFTP